MFIGLIHWLFMCALVFAAYEYGKSMGRFAKCKIPSPPAQNSSFFHDHLYFRVGEHLTRNFF